MKRIFQNRGWAFTRGDATVAAALFAVAFSYALGYRLEWAHGEYSDLAYLEENAGESAESADASDDDAAAIAPDENLLPAAPAPAAPVVRPTPAKPVLRAPTPREAQGQAWAPDPSQAAWDNLTAELSRVAAQHKGRVAVVLKDLKSGRTWSHHQDDLFPSASLIKVPVMASVFQKIRDGKLSLNDGLRLRRPHRVGGSGSIKWRPDGTKLTVRELLYKMIGESDNTATAMLIDEVGLGYIQAQFPNFGLFYTEIFAEGMSIRGGRVAHENYTTAKEMAMLLEKIYKGELVDKSSSVMMLDILKHRKPSRSRLAKHLPRGWELAHKTGLLRQACHDSAIFLTPHGDYLMTVLTGQNNNYRRAKDFISRLGRVTFEHYDAPRYLAKNSGRRGQMVVR